MIGRATTLVGMMRVEMFLSHLILEDMRALAVALAPELGQSVLYVVSHPSVLPMPPNTRAYVVRGPCAPLEKHLRDVGQWAGPGPTIVFCAVKSRDELLVALLHETAHLLPHQPSAEAAALTPPSIADDTITFAAWAASPSPPADTPRWSYGDHGRDFVRIALHLWWRAVCSGEMAEVNHLCAGSLYDLSAAHWYLRALGREPYAMREATFAEILATPAPKRFDDLWHDDLAHWMLNNPEHVHEQLEQRA